MFNKNNNAEIFEKTNIRKKTLKTGFFATIIKKADNNAKLPNKLKNKE